MIYPLCRTLNLIMVVFTDRVKNRIVYEPPYPVPSFTMTNPSFPVFLPLSTFSLCYAEANLTLFILKFSRHRKFCEQYRKLNFQSGKWFGLQRCTCFYLCVTLRIQQQLATESRSAVPWDWRTKSSPGGWMACTIRTLWDDENVLHLHCIGVYTDVYAYQNSSMHKTMFVLNYVSVKLI